MESRLSMSENASEILALVEAGKIDEARAMIDAELVKSKYHPDTIEAESGKAPKFMKNGKPVELGSSGTWRLVE